jgi:hypothetical protein
MTICTVRVEPFSNPVQRASRLLLFSSVLLGLAVLVFWNPVAQPGPKMCMLRHLIGLPCPACGLTRGTALCLRGQVSEATAFNPLALPMLLTALALLSKWAAEYAGNRRIDLVWAPRWKTAFVIAFNLVLLANWIYLIIFRREDPFPSSVLGALLQRTSGGG